MVVPCGGYPLLRCIFNVVATFGGLLFDPTAERAVRLAREALDRCVGVEVDGAKYARVARSLVLRAGPMLRKRLCRA